MGRVRVRRVAFGGGSPNAITPTDFVRLVNALTAIFRWHDRSGRSNSIRGALDAGLGAGIAAVGIDPREPGRADLRAAPAAAIGRVQPDADIAARHDLLRGRASRRSISI